MSHSCASQDIQVSQETRDQTNWQKKQLKKELLKSILNDQNQRERALCEKILIKNSRSGDIYIQMKIE